MTARLLSPEHEVDDKRREEHANRAHEEIEDLIQVHQTPSFPRTRLAAQCMPTEVAKKPTVSTARSGLIVSVSADAIHGAMPPTAASAMAIPFSRSP
jgi:hypothetical protein